MVTQRPKGRSLAARLKAARRVLARPERVHMVYDREGTRISPRPPDYVYAPVAAVLATHDDAYDALIDDLRPMMYGAALDAVPAEPGGAREPHWNNGYFSGIDARAAYALAAARRPARIVEIGSGNSTKFFRKAIDDHGLDCRLVAIDPSPRAEIAGVAHEVVRANVLDVAPERFAALAAGDVLFVDGSHLAVNGADTTRVFLEILPGLAPGVFVHFHDICLPYEYSALFTERLYGEQYLLACTIMDTARWRPLLPIHYLDARGRFGAPPAGGGSFWMVRL